MLTSTDVKQLKKIFLTKDEFKLEMAEQNALNFNTFATKDDLKYLRDEVMERFDALMFEIKAMRENMDAMLYRQREHSDQLENHDHRVVKLETSLQPS